MYEHDRANQYDFETFERMPRTLEATDKTFAKFIRRLGFDNGIDGSGYEEDLRRFVIHVHLSINWYDKKIANERRYRDVYIGASLLLLLLLPFAVMAIDDDGSSAVAALSGLFAFYRGISAWLDQRKIVSQRARASSALKELLYDFEQRWDQVELDTDPVIRRFRANIEALIRRARAIVREETIAFYDAMAYPVFNLGSMLQTSITQLNGLRRGPHGGAGGGAASGGGLAPDRVDEFDEVLPSEKRTRPRASGSDDL